MICRTGPTNLEPVMLDRVHYWFTEKDLDTVNTGQVWDSVWSDNDIDGDNLIIKSDLNLS